ncbi:MAG: iron ABC transporter permease [Propionibacteriaceae bacterium]|nr:iron ABC transporter permease [Propionibacteriaceae bacterium]
MSTPFLHEGRLRPWVLPMLLLLVAATAAVALAIGRFNVSLPDLWEAFHARATGAVHSDPAIDSVVFNLRLPRVIVAILIGAGMAVAGAAYQSLFSNPLATPDTLGVASGTCVGAVLGLLLNWNLVGVQAVALVGGLVTVLITTTVARTRNGRDVVMLVLAGVIVGALADAVLSILKLTADPTSELPEITYWLMGSLAGISYQQITFAVPLLLLGMGVILALRWRLNVLSLSDDEARAAGVNLRTLRIGIIVAGTVVTASVISMCGQVGWIGLIVPHAARMLTGSNNRQLLPVCVLLGAVIMLVIDTVARTITAAEVPVSVVSAIVGAPFFITLLRRTMGSRA